MSDLKSLASAGVPQPVVEPADDEVTAKRRRTRLSNALMSEVWIRDEGKCVQCGSQDDLEFDHIIPFSKGGATNASNLRILCAQCNRSKGARI